MTATDQSFIRAYSDTGVKEHRRTARGGSDQASQGDEVVSHAKTTDQPVSISDLYERQQVGIGAPTNRTQTSSRRTDPRDAVMPPRPHLDPSAFHGSETTMDQRPANAKPETQSADTPLGTANTAHEPSDSPSAMDRIAVVGTRSSLFSGFQAQWEVDRFVWPEVCGTLIERCQQSLSDILRRLLSLSAQGQRVFAITSYSAGEGCSTLAMCLARMAAAEGQRVALLDGNLENPTIGRSLGISFSSGWQDVTQQLPISETAVYSIDDQLNALPISKRAEEINERTKDRGLEVVGYLSDACDLVLIDGGPMFVAARQWFCATVKDCIDGALIIRDLRHTVAEQVDDVCFRIRACGIHEMAVIENFQSQTGCDGRGSDDRSVTLRDAQ